METGAVPIFPVGPTAAWTVLFRENGVTHVTAVVKATFAFSYQGPMRPVQPEPILVAEAHRFNNPTRSIVATSDLAPRIPAADVLLLGHAHAPIQGATQSTVRLAIGRGRDVLLNKVVHVVGDRKGSVVQPFRSIPLVYEKAFGGPGFRDNPIGTGVLAGDPPPNLVDPAARERVVGFGPISRSWPARLSLLPPAARAALEKTIAEIPPGFDFRYFHVAPPDQRVAQLLGDEWIHLEGAHPERPLIHLQLPGAQALLRVSGTDADGRVFSLRADTLRIDADAERCTLVWRNAFPVQESELDVLRFFGGLALPGAPVEWPAHAPVAAPSKPARTVKRRQDVSGTILMEDARPAPLSSGTIELSDGDIEHSLIPEADLAATLPFASSPSVVVAARRKQSPNESTIDLSDDELTDHGDAIPFAAAPAAHSGEDRSSGPIPGSPFGAPGAALQPGAEPSASWPRRPSNEASVTLDVLDNDQESELSSLPAPEQLTLAPAPPKASALPPAAPEPPVPAPTREKRAAPATDPYGQNLRDVSPPAAPPPAAITQEAPKRNAPPQHVLSTLYKGFRR